MIHGYDRFLSSQHMFTIKVLFSLCEKHVSLHLNIKGISLTKGWFVPPFIQFKCFVLSLVEYKE